MGKRKSNTLAKSLLALAKIAVLAVRIIDYENQEAVYYAERLLSLDPQRRNLIKQMATVASILPNRDEEILESILGISQTTALCLLGELGDIRRFSNPNKLNVFVGVDLRHYESGELVLTDHISKRGDMPLLAKFFIAALFKLKPLVEPSLVRSLIITTKENDLLKTKVLRKSRLRQSIN